MFKKVLNAGKKAFKHLQEKGSYKPEDIKEKPYRDLIQATYEVFNTSITDNVISPTLKRALQNDAFLFGGLKTHAQLFEASKLLLDENGNIKSGTKLQEELDKLNVEYNRNYLEAEYQFAIQSSLSADQWERSSDRYNLQYRTANDDRVREEHRVLHGITLPKDDAFWLEYYPPNGWRCRCRAIQVRKEKYEQSNSEEALQKGQKATTQIGKDGKNRLEIFRFNPGMSKQLMPPQHPYKRVAGSSEVQPIVSKIFSDDYKELRKLKDKEIKEWTSTNIPKGGTIIENDIFKTGVVKITRSSIDNLSNHIFDIDNKELVKNLQTILKNAKYSHSASLGEGGTEKSSKNIGRKIARGVESYNYYISEWRGLKVEINMEVMKNGYEQPYAILIEKK